jgi:hypothetical protein
VLTLFFVDAEGRMHCFGEHGYGSVVMFEDNLDIVSNFLSELPAIPTRSLLHEGHWLIRAD